MLANSTAVTVRSAAVLIPASGSLANKPVGVRGDSDHHDLTDVLAPAPHEKYSACSVGVFLLGEGLWREMLFATGAAHTSLPKSSLRRTIEKIGMAPLDLHLVGADGGPIEVEGEVSKLNFTFSIGGPTHTTRCVVGQEQSLPILGTNFIAKVDTVVNFKTRTFTIGNEEVRFRATTESEAAVAEDLGSASMPAVAQHSVLLPPGHKVSVHCALESVPLTVSMAQLFLANALPTGLHKKDEQAFLAPTLTRVEHHPRRGWTANVQLENPTPFDRVIQHGAVWLCLST